MDRWRLNWFSTKWCSAVYGANCDTLAQAKALQSRLIETFEDALTRPFGHRNGSRH